MSKCPREKPKRAIVVAENRFTNVFRILLLFMSDDYVSHPASSIVSSIFSDCKYLIVELS